jgi:FKBP-type peptidyl-prolyl cis-trans isomerase SlyD
MAISKGNFVEVEYTGTLEDGTVFDTTDEKVAKEKGAFQESAEYGPIIICLGEGHILKGLEAKLEGKEAGEEYKFTLAPEEAFGKKDPKLIRLIAANKFTREKITPQPGLEVSVDGVLGVVKTATGGRVMVDMNHPLSGKTVIYTIKPIRIVTDAKEKVASILKIRVGAKDAEISISEESCAIALKQKLPKEIENVVSEEIKRTVALKNVSFEEMKEKKEEAKGETKEEKTEKPKEKAAEEHKEKPEKKHNHK